MSIFDLRLVEPGKGIQPAVGFQLRPANKSDFAIRIRDQFGPRFGGLGRDDCRQAVVSLRLSSSAIHPTLTSLTLRAQPHLNRNQQDRGQS